MRDIKLENCLLKNDNIKICDFGWGARVDNEKYCKE